MNLLKQKKDISTRTLIPFDTYNLITADKIKTQDIILRELPKEIQFSASMWILPDTLVLFSGKYPFIIAVRHKLIKNSLQSVFDFLWKISSGKI